MAPNFQGYNLGSCLSRRQEVNIGKHSGEGMGLLIISSAIVPIESMPDSIKIRKQDQLAEKNPIVAFPQHEILGEIPISWNPFFQ